MIHSLLFETSPLSLLDFLTSDCTLFGLDDGRLDARQVLAYIRLLRGDDLGLFVQRLLNLLRRHLLSLSLLLVFHLQHKSSQVADSDSMPESINIVVAQTLS